MDRPLTEDFSDAGPRPFATEPHPGMHPDAPNDAPETTAHSYLIGQPVGWLSSDASSVATLRVCIGARHVTECWSANTETARRNLRQMLDRVETMIRKLDSQVHCRDPQRQELSHAN